MIVPSQIFLLCTIGGSVGGDFGDFALISGSIGGVFGDSEEWNSAQVYSTTVATVARAN